MATKDAPIRHVKEPGRLKQLWTVLRMTLREDPSSRLWLSLSVLGPIALGIAAAFIWSSGNVFGIILWILIGVLAGALTFLIVFGRLAEKAAYSQIEGQPGAVSALLRSSLRRGWRASEMPVAVNPKSQDAVYRAIGRPGVVLIAEGARTRMTRLIDEERRKVSRVAPSVPIHVIHVGTDAESVRLYRLNRALGGLKKSISKAEVVAVANRLESIGTAKLPIPKGIDPNRVRSQRPR
jgi:hypothetical protein